MITLTQSGRVSIRFRRIMLRHLVENLLLKLFIHYHPVEQAFDWPEFQQIMDWFWKSSPDIDPLF